MAPLLAGWSLENVVISPNLRGFFFFMLKIGINVDSAELLKGINDIRKGLDTVYILTE